MATTRSFAFTISMNFQELPVPERGEFELLNDDVSDVLRNYLNAHIIGFIPYNIPSYTVLVYDYEDGRPGGTIDFIAVVSVPLGTTRLSIEQLI